MARSLAFVRAGSTAAVPKERIQQKASTDEVPEFWRDDASLSAHTPRRYFSDVCVSENGRCHASNLCGSTSRRQDESSDFREQIRRYEARVCGWSVPPKHRR